MLITILFPPEHTQAFNRAGEKNWKTLTQQYHSVLKSLRDEPRAKCATVRVGKGTEVTLRSTYLCLQCPNIFPQEGIENHFKGPKAHSFCEFFKIHWACMDAMLTKELYSCGE